MGTTSQLHRAVERIETAIALRGLDRFRTRGAIALEAGLTIGFITRHTPDDDEKLARLRKATREILGVLI
jgi:hypothetical protein